MSDPKVAWDTADAFLVGVPSEPVEVAVKRYTWIIEHDFGEGWEIGLSWCSTDETEAEKTLAWCVGNGRPSWLRYRLVKYEAMDADQQEGLEG